MLNMCCHIVHYVMHGLDDLDVCSRITYPEELNTRDGKHYQYKHDHEEYAAH